MKKYRTLKEAEVAREDSKTYFFEEKLYGISDAAKLLGVHPQTIRRWDNEGKIKVIRTKGGHRRIPRSEIAKIKGFKSEKIVRAVET